MVLQIIEWWVSSVKLRIWIIDIFVVKLQIDLHQGITFFLIIAEQKKYNSIHLTIWHENMYVTSLEAGKFKLHSSVNISWINHEYDHNLVDLMCIYELFFVGTSFYLCNYSDVLFSSSLHLALYASSLNCRLACTAIYTMDDRVSFVCRLGDGSEHYEITYPDISGNPIERQCATGNIQANLTNIKLFSLWTFSATP